MNEKDGEEQELRNIHSISGRIMKIDESKKMRKRAVSKQIEFNRNSSEFLPSQSALSNYLLLVVDDASLPNEN